MMDRNIVSVLGSNMKQKKDWREVFRTMLAEKLAKAKTDDIEEDLEQLVELLLAQSRTETHYNRILGAEEKAVLTNDAFGYLLELYALGTIDRLTFEKIVHLCLHLVVFVQRQIDLPLIEQLVNLVLFSSEGDVSVKEIVDIFLKGEMPEAPAHIH